MGKKRNAKGAVSVTQNTKGQAFEFDYEKLAKAIVHAQTEAEILREKEKEKLAEEQHRQWLKVLGQKTYLKENCITRILHRWRNNIVGFFKIMFLSRKKAQGDRATFVLLQLGLSLLFGAVKLFCYLMTIFFIAIGIYSFVQKTLDFSLLPFLYAIPTFILGRVFRIAKFEIEKMTDRNYMLSILSAVTALIAMIITLVALFVR